MTPESGIIHSLMLIVFQQIGLKLDLMLGFRIDLNIDVNRNREMFTFRLTLGWFKN